MEIFLKIIEFIAKFILPIVIAWLVVKEINKVMSKERIGKNLGLVVLRPLIIILVWAAAISAVLQNSGHFSKTWETILTSASVVSVVLGLAAQETLGNVFAGISMSIGESKPFAIGDRVKIGDADAGTVEDFTLRHVEISTYLHEHIYIPNSVVASSKIINYTKGGDGSSYPIEISVAYESDLDKAMEIMSDVVFQHPKFFGTEKPNVLCKEAGDSGITLRVVVTTEHQADNAKACSDCLVETMKRFNEEGIEIPYNKLEILKNQVTVRKIHPDKEHGKTSA